MDEFRLLVEEAQDRLVHGYATDVEDAVDQLRYEGLATIFEASALRHALTYQEGVMDLAEFVSDHLGDGRGRVRAYDIAIAYVDTYMAYNGTDFGGDSEAWFWHEVAQVEPQLGYYL